MWDVERTKASARAVEDGRLGGRTQAEIQLDITMKASGDIFDFWRILTETAKVGSKLRELHLNKEGQLHCETGPAVVIEDFEDFKEYEVEAKWYYLQGNKVPAIVIEDPDNVTMKDIQDEQNAEIRRIIIEHLGSDRFAAALDLEIIDEQELNGQKVALLRTKEADDMARSKIQFVRVECTSTGRMYHICVPMIKEDREEMNDSLEAVAWTFGMEKNEYKPTVET